MKLNRIKKYWIPIALLLSMFLNVILGSILFSKKPFVYKESTTTFFFTIGEARPEYDISVIDNGMVAACFAQNVWEEKFGNKNKRPYGIISVEHIDSRYLKKLDFWVVTSDQTVGIWEWSPYAIFDSEGNHAVAFLSPFELFD